ncbi:MAG: DNA replication/repair protein RecF [Gemmobacter sp.]
MPGFGLSTLSLSHFRSHLSARIRFDGRPLAISGPNGAGKTNILEAVSLLSPGQGFRRATPGDIARRPEGVGWKVVAEVDAPDGAHQLETWAEGAERRQVRIDGKTATQGALGRVMRVLWLVPAMDRLWLDGAEGRRRWLDRAAMSFAPDHAESVQDYERAMRERNRLLRDQVRDAHWYAALEAQMVAAAGAMGVNRTRALDRLAASQPADSNVFPRADLRLVFPEGEPAEGEALAQALSRGRRRDMAAGRTLAGPHRAELEAIYAAKGMAAAQCSTGEQKALLISLILANARALAADLGSAPVLLLDEVAAHLDPDRRAALYDAIVAMGAQALMTGTEAALFHSLGERAQTLHVADHGGQSRIT